MKEGFANGLESQSTLPAPHRSGYLLLNHTGIPAILLIPQDLATTSLLIAHAISHYHHAEEPSSQ